MIQLPEAELERRLAARFAPYFHTKRQVWSVDGTCRIDLIIQHKQKPWLVAGIEVKSTQRKKGVDLADFCLQAQRYTFCTWKGYEKYGEIPIFIYPELSSVYLEYLDPSAGRPTHDRNHSHHNVNSFLGRAFSIGEVRTINHNGEKLLGLRHTNKSIWREFGKDILDLCHEYNYHHIKDIYDV